MFSRKNIRVITFFSEYRYAIFQVPTAFRIRKEGAVLSFLNLFLFFQVRNEVHFWNEDGNQKTGKKLMFVVDRNLAFKLRHSREYE